MTKILHERSYAAEVDILFPRAWFFPKTNLFEVDEYHFPLTEQEVV
jgi:hypothetical protein